MACVDTWLLDAHNLPTDEEDGNEDDEHNDSNAIEPRPSSANEEDEVPSIVTKLPGNNADVSVLTDQHQVAETAAINFTAPSGPSPNSAQAIPPNNASLLTQPTPPLLSTCSGTLAALASLPIGAFGRTGLSSTSAAPPVDAANYHDEDVMMPPMAETTNVTNTTANDGGNDGLMQGTLSVASSLGANAVAATCGIGV